MAKILNFLVFFAQIAFGLAWVALFTSEAVFKGQQITLKGLEHECLNLRDFVPKSISTNNYCVKLYEGVDCKGRSLSFFPGSQYHNHLSHFNMDFKSVKSCQTSF